MADISKITTLDGTTYNIKDANAVKKAGDTMTGNLVVPAERIANTYYGVSFDRTTQTPVETILYTGIKWMSGSHMPVVHVTGYAYGLQSPVEFKIGFYIYNGDIGWSGVTNMGAWQPDVYLFKYTHSTNGACVAIGFAGSCYFLQLQVDVQDEMGKFGNIVTDRSAWTWTFSTTTGVIPALSAGQCIKVPYKADVLNAAKVNGHTVLKDVPANAVFTDTTYSANTSKLVTTTVPNITSVGSAPTLGTAIPADDITAWDAGSTPTLGTAIPADDITAWTSNTPTAVSVSQGVLTLTSGTAASLSYTAKSIPNVTSVGTKPSLSYTAKSIPNVTSVGSAPTLGTAITVATGSLSGSGSGATVATGITAS